MQLKTVYMKACNMAINISKTMMQASNKNGITPKIPNAAINPAMILSIMCPTVILATRRTVRLNGFDKYDIVSIGIISGAKAKGIPLGKNVLKNLIFFFLMPTHMLNNNAITDKPPTAAKCEVYVKASGNRPVTFPNRTNRNTVNINEKYFNPSGPTFSSNRLCMNKYIDSGIDWATPGTMLLFLKHNKNMALETNTAMTIHKDELVKEISTPPSSMLNSGLISNCSIGFDTRLLLCVLAFQLFGKTIYVQKTRGAAE